jgi:hypothetical protein
MQIANTTLQSQIPSTEDQAEKEKMKAVLQQLSANMTVINDTLSKKLQLFVEDESKNKVSLCVHFGLAVIKSLEAGPSFSAISVLVRTWVLFETWSLLTCWYLNV